MFKSKLFLSVLTISSLYMFQGLPGLAQMPSPSPTPAPTTTTTSTAPRCGNMRVESSEQCDDGNTVDGDGCSCTCQFEAARPPNVFASPTPTPAPTY